MDRNTIKNILKFLALVGLMTQFFFLIPIIAGVIYGENVTPFVLSLIHI